MSTTEIDRQWTTRLRRRVAGKLPQKAAARYAAHVRRFVDLRLWRHDDGRPRRRHRLGLSPALRGPQWWHTSSVGHFVNSLHLWSVEIFFFAMVIHLWASTSWPRGAEAVRSRG